MRFVIILAAILFIYPFKLNSQERGVEYEWMVENLGLDRFGVDDNEFMYALMKGDMITLKKYVNYEYNINKKYENGITPLVYAVYSGNSKVVKFLIKNGADVDVSANSLMINVMGIDFLEYTMAPILLATIKNDLGIVKMLLNAGAQVDKKDSNDRTSLIWATIVGYAPMVATLIKGGADINYTIPIFNLGKTEYKNIDALYIAALRSDYDSVKVLLKNTKFNRIKYLECLRVSVDEDIRAMFLKSLKKNTKVREQ